MDLRIAGKVAFFTGGSKGMGRVAARMLADEDSVNTVAPGWIETQNAIAYLDRQAGLTSPGERAG